MSLFSFQVDERNCAHKHITKVHNTTWNASPYPQLPPCLQKANVWTKKERKPLLKITLWLNFKTKRHTHTWDPQMHTSDFPKHCLVFTSPPRKKYYTGRKVQSQTGHLTDTPFNIIRKFSSDTQNIIRISCFLWTLTSLPHEGDYCPQEKTLFLEHLCT